MQATVRNLALERRGMIWTKCGPISCLVQVNWGMCYSHSLTARILHFLFENTPQNYVVRELYLSRPAAGLQYLKLSVVSGSSVPWHWDLLALIKFSGSWHWKVQKQEDTSSKDPNVSRGQSHGSQSQWGPDRDHRARAGKRWSGSWTWLGAPWWQPHPWCRDQLWFADDSQQATWAEPHWQGAAFIPWSAASSVAVGP